VQKKAEDVRAGDQVLRYGMWFNVEKVEKLPAARGGHVHQLSLIPAPNRIPAGPESTLTLFPGELITYEHRQIATD
jgi:hypothetical protein